MAMRAVTAAGALQPAVEQAAGQRAGEAEGGGGDEREAEARTEPRRSGGGTVS